MPANMSPEISASPAMERRGMKVVSLRPVAGGVGRVKWSEMNVEEKTRYEVEAEYDEDGYVKEIIARKIVMPLYPEFPGNRVVREIAFKVAADEKTLYRIEDGKTRYDWYGTGPVYRITINYNEEWEGGMEPYVIEDYEELKRDIEAHGVKAAIENLIEAINEIVRIPKLDEEE